MSIKIVHKYIYTYKRNSDSLNIRRNNRIEIKNFFDRLKMLGCSVGMKFLRTYLDNSIKIYGRIKDNELKHHIFYSLIHYMNYVKKKDYVYNIINIFLNKLSEEKLVIFYDSSNRTNFFYSGLITFKDIIMKYKKFIAIDCTKKKILEIYHR